MNTSPARSKLVAVTVALLFSTIGLTGCTLTVDVPVPDGVGKGFDDGSGPAVADPSGCMRTSDTGTSSNTGMQELARALYDSLTCDGDVPIEQQLIDGANEPAFRQRAADVGATVTVSNEASTLGNTEFSAEVWLWDERRPEYTGVCSLLITSTPEGKSLMCEDVAHDAFSAPRAISPMAAGGSILT